jgi:hypothetical protein
MRAGRGRDPPPVHREEIAVGEVDGSRLQVRDQAIPEDLFTDLTRVDLRGQHPAGAARHQGDDPCLREPPTRRVANLAPIASVAARSNAVPSVAVTNNPNTSDPAAATRTPAPAAVWANNSRSTATGNRALACDNATTQTGAHITTTGLLPRSSNGL